jgi:hypothetical protein
LKVCSFNAPKAQVLSIKTTRTRRTSIAQKAKARSYFVAHKAEGEEMVGNEGPEPPTSSV